MTETCDCPICPLIDNNVSVAEIDFKYNDKKQTFRCTLENKYPEYIQYINSFNSLIEAQRNRAFRVGDMIKRSGLNFEYQIHRFSKFEYKLTFITVEKEDDEPQDPTN